MVMPYSETHTDHAIIAQRNTLFNNTPTTNKATKPYIRGAIHYGACRYMAVISNGCIVFD